MSKNLVGIAERGVDSFPTKSSFVLENSNEATYGFGKKLMHSADAIPFDELAKLSAEGTLALGAVPAAMICMIIFGLASLAVMKFVVTRSSMGLAMRAPDARDVFV